MHKNVAVKLDSLRRVLRVVYNVLFIVATPFILLRLLLKARKQPLYSKMWWQRFGFGYGNKLFGSLWLHAVSLGEVNAMLPLLKKLQKQYPDLPFVVTTMTATGRNKLESAFAKDPQIHIFFVPYDFGFAVQSFLRYANPNKLVIMETELWPNMIYYAYKHGVPIFSVNARISDRAFPKYERIKFLLKPFLNLLTKVAVQSEIDGEKFLALGLNAEKMQVIGNIKFDLTLPDDLQDKAKRISEEFNLGGRLMWLAASTHPSEEELVLDAAEKINSKLENVFLVLAPRHPERCPEVLALCERRGFKTKLYTKGDACDPETQILIVDTVGKLLYFYALCEVALVAGSLVNIGGHNILEPAALGKSIVTGPYLQNLKETAAGLLARKAFIKVDDVNRIGEEIGALLGDVAMRDELAKSAKKVVDENRGVVDKLVDLIRK